MRLAIAACVFLAASGAAYANPVERLRARAGDCLFVYFMQELDVDTRRRQPTCNEPVPNIIHGESWPERITDEMALIRDMPERERQALYDRSEADRPLKHLFLVD